MLPLEVTLADMHLSALVPVFIVVGGALVGLLVEAFAPRHARYVGEVTVTVLTIVAAFVVTVRNWAIGKITLSGAGLLAVDGPSYFIWSMLLVFGLLSVLLFAERRVAGGVSAFTAQAATTPGSPAETEALGARQEHTEVFPLALFSLSGMMMFASSNDLIMAFVALEVMSLPLYLLCGLARRRRLLSQEAAMKYFLLGALSSAIFLYGMALIYGYSSTFNLALIRAAIANPVQSVGLLYAGVALIAVGLLFKIGAVPFHNWTPDVYQGAPTPVTAFMAACTKIAAAGALLRVLYVAFGDVLWTWQAVLAVVAVLTMGVGSVLAIVQTDIKRMLAYSSVAHAGFLMTAVAAVAGGPGHQIEGIDSVGAVMFYLAAYGFATLGAFGIVTMVRRQDSEQTTIAHWSGIGRQRPVLGITFAFFLLSFAGIPLTAGFIGKWAVFVAAWRGGFWWLVVVAVVMSLVAAFFYLRVIVVMFFGDPQDDDDPAEIAPASILTWIPVTLGALGTVVLGLFPGPVLDLAMRASAFLH